MDVTMRDLFSIRAMPIRYPFKVCSIAFDLRFPKTVNRATERTREVFLAHTIHVHTHKNL